MRSLGIRLGVASMRWICGVLAGAAALLVSEAAEPDKARPHWAFAPIQKVVPPEVKQSPWVRNPIDRFILARMEAAGLKPAPSAPPHELRRRLHFGLTGLPPAPSATAAAAADAALVDQLLASPHYGERWARHWLDVVRYADSNGLDENAAHANAWRYRDYVLNSFNADKPYSRFLTEQIAGDLLPAAGAPQRHEQITATGFLTLGPKVLAEPDKMKMEMDIIDEQIDTLGRAVLGLTLGCARCHDHKFDPIATAEYYALAGIFKSTRSMASLVTIAKWYEHPLATPQQAQLEEKHRALVEAQKKVIAAFVEKANQQLLVDKAPAPLPAKPEEQYGKDTRDELEGLRARLKQMESGAPRMPSAMGVADGAATNLPVFLRGDHDSPGTVQPRRFPRVLSSGQPLALEGNASGRLELAQWLAGAENPLTARVLVNRVWRWHFGRGIVPTPDNFGLQGEPPTHPELLDWLAGWFVENGSSLKKLNRLIVTSATYQQASAASAESLARDPDNLLYTRAPLRRLEAEALRDAMLEVCGLLDRTVGGTLWEFENYKLVFDHTSKDMTTYETRRRSLYLPVIRNHVFDQFELFDFPNPNMMSGDRAASTVAPQALYLMNSPLVLRAAEALALRLTEAPPQERVAQLYQRVLARPPTPTESARAVAFVARFPGSPGTTVKAAAPAPVWQALAQALLAGNEFIYLR